VDLRSRFAENLVRHRKRAELSQEALAARAAIHRTEVGLLERGERIPRIDTLVKLAGSLSVPPGDLLDGIAWKPVSTKTGEFEVSAPRAKKR
jgi:transcriptional regulator with XRE-family HTH domain